MEVGVMATAISVAIMVLTMLIFVGFRAGDENTRSETLWAAHQALGAGLMAYIILSPITYEVKNESLVTACIIPLMFLIACFAFEIDVDERKGKELK